MQQVHSLGFRLGSTVGWQSSSYNQSSPEMNAQVNALVKHAMATRGAFLLNNYIYYHRGVAFCVIMFYRYYQRSRLPKWLVGYLNRREGALAPQMTRNYVLHHLDLNSKKSWWGRKRSLRKVFPKAGLKPWQKGSQNSWNMRGWIDLEYRTIRIFRRWPAHHFNYQMRKETAGMLARTDFRAYNVFDFTKAVNPIAVSRHYILKRFGSMLYQADVLESVYLAMQLNLSSLLAHTVTLGLERHARSRQQRRFLKMIRVTIEHLMTWKIARLRAVWRLSVFGKLDAKMRRTHFKLRVGFVRYQHLDFILSYTQDVARTRFGTSSVRVWMRNLLK